MQKTNYDKTIKDYVLDFIRFKTCKYNILQKEKN